MRKRSCECTDDAADALAYPPTLAAVGWADVRHRACDANERIVFVIQPLQRSQCKNLSIMPGAVN
jgi:hypothetical protein